MLSFMSEKKRILNLNEKKFVELVMFQANTTLFQANANVSPNGPCYVVSV